MLIHLVLTSCITHIWHTRTRTHVHTHVPMHARTHAPKVNFSIVPRKPSLFKSQSLLSNLEIACYTGQGCESQDLSISANPARTDFKHSPPCQLFMWVVAIQLWFIKCCPRSLPAKPSCQPQETFLLYKIFLDSKIVNNHFTSLNAYWSSVCGHSPWLRKVSCWQDNLALWSHDQRYRFQLLEEGCSNCWS